jgi:tRNA-Thr(GGU) m(6)t(6)A37 methyltransferase TsaA
VPHALSAPDTGPEGRVVPARLDGSCGGWHLAAMSDLRPGEIAINLPTHTDAAIYFIGAIRTPWKTRSECPKRGTTDGPICTIDLDPRWQQGLTGIDAHARLQVLYWMHQSRRDVVLQMPLSTLKTSGVFALRSPLRPNPIASSIVVLEGVSGTALRVRGLDCIDGTPLIDLKPHRPVD